MEFSRGKIDFCGRNFESNSLVWLSGHQKILVSWVLRLFLLFISAHDPVFRLLNQLVCHEFRIVDVEQKRLLSSFRVLLLYNFVPRLTNFLVLFTPYIFDYTALWQSVDCSLPVFAHFTLL